MKSHVMEVRVAEEWIDLESIPKNWNVYLEVPIRSNKNTCLAYWPIVALLFVEET